jgi:predicted DNA-binding transcriptional regulator YafY
VPSRRDLLSAVTALRAVDANARRPLPDPDAAPTSAMDPMDPARTLRILRDALTSGQDTWLGYVDEGTGRPERRVVQPLEVGAGRVRALERASGRIRSYPVHRLIAATPVPAGSRDRSPADLNGTGLDDDPRNDAGVPVKGAG